MRGRGWDAKGERERWGGRGILRVTEVRGGGTGVEEVGFFRPGRRRGRGSGWEGERGSLRAGGGGRDWGLARGERRGGPQANILYISSRGPTEGVIRVRVISFWPFDQWLNFLVISVESFLLRFLCRQSS